MNKTLAILFLLAACTSPRKMASPSSASAGEPYRPQLHFTPPQKWMNDPNGMVFLNGRYHLFYQYYPDSTVWGPMHWGHATSSDLVHWQHRPVALYPDRLGYIFSGSAVVDSNNTSGFGRDGKAPLVAVFTQHDPAGEKRGRKDFQNESIAYSLDEGGTWTKYAANPVLRNPGVSDFRDPKVFWYEPTKSWIMSLATHDQVSFYSSPDLKTWRQEGAFGRGDGAHGGVWECPDLFPMQVGDKEFWVLLVSINPGGPNGGSATQYFVGEFDGHDFLPYYSPAQWIDYGPDDYAGVTWSNTGGRRIFMGWMSNWQYADKVPTEGWRGAMTLPRELSLKKLGDRYLLASRPADELESLTGKTDRKQYIDARTWSVQDARGLGTFRLHLSADSLRGFSLTLSNDRGERLVIGYDESRLQYFIDRSASGQASFEKGFAARHTAPRLVQGGADITLVFDRASVELFADGGVTTMTEIFFPTMPYTRIGLSAASPLALRTLEFAPLKSMYNGK